MSLPWVRGKRGHMSKEDWVAIYDEVYDEATAKGLSEDEACALVEQLYADRQAARVDRARGLMKEQV